MKVTVSGIGSFANRGVEALAVSTIEGLLASRPDIDITILTNDPRTLEAYRYSYYFSDRSARIHFDVFDRARSIYLSRLGRCGNLLKRRLLPGLIETANLVAQSDLLIFSGGDNLSSDYGSPSRWLRCLHYASRRNTPFVLHAQSIGIFREQQHVNEFLAVAQKAHLITVRERASYDYVTQELGVDTAKVKLTADPAFLLKPPPKEKVDQLFKYYGLDLSKPKVALAVSQGITHFKKLDRDAHLSKLKQLVTRLLQIQDLQVLVIPHVHDCRVHNNDLLLAYDLVQGLGFHDRVVAATLNHSASEYKGMIGRCDMVIAERMHAAIAGLSSGVATAVIGYSIKGQGIIADFMGDQAQEQGYIISVEDFIASERSQDNLLNLWNGREEACLRIRQGLPGVQARAQANFDLINDLFVDAGKQTESRLRPICGNQHA